MLTQSTGEPCPFEFCRKGRQLRNQIFRLPLTHFPIYMFGRFQDLTQELPHEVGLNFFLPLQLPQVVFKADSQVQIVLCTSFFSIPLLKVECVFLIDFLKDFCQVLSCFNGEHMYDAVIDGI